MKKTDDFFTEEQEIEYDSSLEKLSDELAKKQESFKDMLKISLGASISLRVPEKKIDYTSEEIIKHNVTEEYKEIKEPDKVIDDEQAVLEARFEKLMKISHPKKISKISEAEEEELDTRLNALTRMGSGEKNIEDLQAWIDALKSDPLYRKGEGNVRIIDSSSVKKSQEFYSPRFEFSRRESLWSESEVVWLERLSNLKN